MNMYITECGAVADGVTMSTNAINETINKVAEAGGGYAIVPPGEYVSGTIELKSNVYLYLEPGATVYGSMAIEDFKGATKRIGCKTMVLAEDLVNTGILGHGTLDLRRQGLGYTAEHGRPCLVVLVDCENITLRGVSLINTGFFTIYSGHNTNATFDSLIINSEDCDNGDGIDFSGSKNVTISNCKIRAWDDAIGLKTHCPDAPCENFTITNCVLSSNWAGVRIGPETCGDMLNISISNCVFNDCSDGVKVQLCDTYRMEDLTFSNLNMVHVLRPFFFTSSSCRMSGHSKGSRPAPGVFKRVLISNVIAHMTKDLRKDWFENMIVINGLPDSYIEDIMISNMHVVAPGGLADDGSSAENEELIEYNNYPDLVFQWEPYPCSCMYIRNAARVRLNNCVFETTLSDERPAIAAQSVDGLKITNSEAYCKGGLIRHYRVDGLRIVDSEGAVLEESLEYKERWDAFREFSVKNEEMLIKNAALVDQVRTWDKAATLTVSDECTCEAEFTFENPGENPHLLIGQVSASPRVTLNGKEIYFWDRWSKGSMYSSRIPIAVDLSDGLVEGENTLKITLEGGNTEFADKNLSICIPKKD